MGVELTGEEVGGEEENKSEVRRKGWHEIKEKNGRKNKLWRSWCMNIPAHFCTLSCSYGKFQLQKSCTSILPEVRSKALPVGLSVVPYCIILFVVFFLCSSLYCSLFWWFTPSASSPSVPAPTTLFNLIANWNK